MISPSFGAASAGRFAKSLTGRAVRRSVAKVSVLAESNVLDGSSAATQSGALPSGSRTRQLEFWKRTTSPVLSSESACVMLVALTGVVSSPSGPATWASPDSRVTVSTSRGVFCTCPEAYASDRIAVVTRNAPRKTRSFVTIPRTA